MFKNFRIISFMMFCFAVIVTILKLTGVINISFYNEPAVMFWSCYGCIMVTVFVFSFGDRDVKK